MKVSRGQPPALETVSFDKGVQAIAPGRISMFPSSISTRADLALWEDLHLPATGWTFGRLLLAPA